MSRYHVDRKAGGLIGLSVVGAVAFSLLGGAGAVEAKDIAGTYQLSGDETEQLVVKGGTNVTLDLNGHNLIVNDADAIVVELGGTLTIDGDGTVEATGSGVSPIYNSGTTTINGGTYVKDESKGRYYAILNHGDMIINAGTVKMENYQTSSLIDNGYYNYTKTSAGAKTAYIVGTNNEKANLTISGGEFIGGGNEVKNDDGGYLTINDGYFYVFEPASVKRVAVMNNNVATINGGTFKADGGLQTAVTNRYYGGGENAGELTINGGEYMAVSLINTNDVPTETPIKVTGGTFNVQEVVASNSKSITQPVEVTGGSFPSVTSVSGAVTVKGGTFAKEASVAPAEGYTTIKDENGDDKVVTIAEAERIAKEAEEAKKAAEAKETTKAREEVDGKGSGIEITAPNSGAAEAGGLSLSALASGLTAIVSAGAAIIAKIKL